MAKSLRSNLYWSARMLGNLQAAAKGPIPYSKRVVRRSVYRNTLRLEGKALRGFRV